MDPSASSDEELALSAGRGNSQAFRELVERHKSYVYTLLLQMTGHRETAEDLAQEVFLKLYRSLGQFRAEARFTTWLYRIAANAGADYKRSQSRNPLLKLLKLGRDPTVVKDVTPIEEDPERHAVAKEKQEQLQRLVGALPDKYKLVMFLYHYRQLSVQEIAAIADLPVKTVETRLYRGRAMLRDQWKEMDPHEFRFGLE